MEGSLSGPRSSGKHQQPFTDWETITGCLEAVADTRLDGKGGQKHQEKGQQIAQPATSTRRAELFYQDVLTHSKHFILMLKLDCTFLLNTYLSVNLTCLDPKVFG
ncbi:hypothetical protein AMECASPLE_031716 [Ameca splendens]|uniref:Myb proto-oncogene protein, plant n=1 Tax=Ameca splendens TaxID=208324 RepID=A0ABV1AFD7_9TELE